MEVDHATLLRRFAEKGCQEAFSELVRRHMDQVYSAALRRLGNNRHLAQEVAQDVFVQVAQRASTLASHPAFSAWLHTATRHAALNRIRTEVRRSARESAAMNDEAALGAPDDSPKWENVAPVLDGAIDSLSERDRRALILRFFDRQTFSQIGAALQLSEDAARMRVDRALAKVRQLLKARGIRSSAAALGLAIAENAVRAAPAGAVEAAVGAAVSGTGVGASGGAGLAVLQTSPVGLLAALLMFGVFWGVREWQDVAAVRLAIAKEAAEFESAERGAARARRLEAAAMPAVTASPKQVLAGREVAEGVPTRRLLAGGRRTRVTAAYSAFYDTLRLTPGQREQFEAAYLQAPGFGLWTYDEEPDDSTRASTLTVEERNRRLAALLGPEGFRQFREYQRTVAARDLAAQLAGAVYADAPMTRENGNALAEIVAQFSPSYREGKEIDLAGVEWDRVTASAKKILTPAQVEVLAALCRCIQFEEQLFNRLESQAEKGAR